MNNNDIFTFNNVSCAVCNKTFDDTSDIVVCPVCGAPHHRKCYNKTNNCYYKSKHGTEKQWTSGLEELPEYIVCRNCGTKNDPQNSRCSKCKLTLQDPDMDSDTADVFPVTEQQSSIRPVYAEDEDAGDFALFIGPNADYYLNRFDFKNEKRQTRRFSWNWGGALFPAEWALYRKMIVPFILIIIFFTLISVPQIYVLIVAMQKTEYFALNPLQTMAHVLSLMPKWFKFIHKIAPWIAVLARFVMGLTANSFYGKYVKYKVNNIRKTHGHNDLMLRYVLSKKGGTSLKYLMGYFAFIILIVVLNALMYYII